MAEGSPPEAMYVVLDGELDDFIQAYLRKKAEKEHKKPPTKNGKGE